MKKLMIAAAVVFAAVTVNAAAANWSATASNIFNGTGVSTAAGRYAGTAYIFDATKTTQEALFDLWLDGQTIGSGTAGYAATGTVSGGALSATAFSYGEQSTEEQTNNYKFYIAIVDGTAADSGKMYFSQLISKNASQTSTSISLAFGNQAPQSQTKPAGIGYAGEKAWSTPAPEPTSALLMLLGMAGLALRRKQK